MQKDVEKYRGELIEEIVHHDEAQMECYLEGKEVPVDELKKKRLPVSSVSVRETNDSKATYSA